ncbi:MAG: hypothetical protein GY745_23605 [Actinomycetia bacterium]|nr:hypothetical protein [Actinomycetes bacterium]MCP4088003.1 hypothetical protein [Actinomycetes bacterium]
MTKGSANKKVERAAAAGGKASAEKRNLLFPLSVAGVVVLGLGLVLIARSGRDSFDLAAPPRINQDHWHVAYGVYDCVAESDSDDGFLPIYTDQRDPGGIHSHGDGIIHIHPRSTAAAGPNADLGVFLDAVGATLSEDEFDPGVAGDARGAGDECSNGEPGIPQVAFWSDADELAQPDVVATTDLQDLQWIGDGGAVTIAFAPEGADIPPPLRSIPNLSRLTDVPGFTPSLPPVDPDTFDPTAATIPGTGDAEPDEGDADESPEGDSAETPTTTSPVEE